MKINLVTIILACSLLFISCSTEPENDYEKFKIKIDKITIPDTISTNDTLSIKFDGFIGPNGCYRFKNFEVINRPNQIHFTVWGEKPNYESICTDALVFLNEKEYKLKLTTSGTYNFFIHQPDKTILIDSIYVK